MEDTLECLLSVVGYWEGEFCQRTLERAGPQNEHASSCLQKRPHSQLKEEKKDLMSSGFETKWTINKQMVKRAILCFYHHIFLDSLRKNPMYYKRTPNFRTQNFQKNLLELKSNHSSLWVKNQGSTIRTDRWPVRATAACVVTKSSSFASIFVCC